MDHTQYCINWDSCTLCQLKNTNEKLVSPVNDKRKGRGTGYKSLANNLPKFKELGQLSLKPEGVGIEEKLRSHQASGTNHVSINATVQSLPALRRSMLRSARTTQIRKLLQNRVRLKSACLSWNSSQVLD